ncbi:MAG: hypothetical protein WAQ99_03380 [Pyrinomonadaceae bacterium]
MTKITNIALAFVFAIFTAALAVAQTAKSEKSGDDKYSKPARGIRRQGTLRRKRHAVDQIQTERHEPRQSS